MKKLRALAMALLAPAVVTAAAADTVRLAVTTSTDNSGLIQAVLPEFERSAGIRVQVIAAGTGRALQIGRRGDADAILVHARDLELAFMESGHGAHRREVMFNDFILAGPAADPAGARDAATAAGAFAAVAAAGEGGGARVEIDGTDVEDGDSAVIFVSRGDQSGTHRRELKLWRAAGVAPGGDWYREAGQGMGKVLLIASELGAYVLVDRGTWLAYRGRAALAVLAEGDAALRNVYSVITVNPQKNPHVNNKGARKLVDWLTSRAGQRAIGGFRIQGEVLFHPLVHPR
ncbi:MAG: substrate-binding domain-containing protein [Gammaproteobacteria bacterium]|nr:substrate-binding domain-containing protein [Gammaproteobacteria bacterium]